MWKGLQQNSLVEFARPLITGSVADPADGCRSWQKPCSPAERPVSGKCRQTGPKVRGPVRSEKVDKEDHQLPRTPTEPEYSQSSSLGKLGDETSCYMKARVLGLGLGALYDTGASCSVLSLSVWNSIPEERRPPLEPSSRVLKQAADDPVYIEGVANLQIELHGRQIEHKMEIAEVRDDIILGLDLLKLHGINWNIRTMEPEWPQTDFCSETRSGSGDASQPEVSTDEIGEWAVNDDSAEFDDSELQDMEVFDEEPRGVGDRYPKRHRTLGYGRLARVRLEAPIVEAVHVIRAIGSQEVSAPEVPSGVPEHLQKLFGDSCGLLSPDQRQELAKIMIEYQDSFSKHDMDLGRTTLEVHRIPTGDAKPVRLPPRRAPMHMQGDVSTQIEQLIACGAVEDCTSPWAFPLVIVSKKDGRKRICVDYRKLNDLTVPDGHALPRLDDSLDQLRGATVYSTLDMTMGYHQVLVAEEDRDKTAFVDGRGHHLRYVTMPFGLNNAPATFQRLMEKVLKGLIYKFVVVYLDDVVIYSESIEKHLEHLRQVLERFKKAGLKLKPKKCELCRNQVDYLGHTVSPEGKATKADLIEKVQNWDPPRTVRQVRQFLGLANYYHDYVKSYSDIVEPMIRLTDKKVKFVWTPECQEAFETLKVKLTTAPVLGFASMEDPFILDTDASDVAMGAVLSQVQNGQERVIAYGSKALSKEERNYCVTRRELLAVVYFVDHYKYYLAGGKLFTIRTDHASLRWMMNQKEPEHQLARWYARLSGYKPFEFQHRPGKKHGNADSLSRLGSGKCFRGGNCLCQQQEVECPDPYGLAPGEKSASEMVAIIRDASAGEEPQAEPVADDLEVEVQDEASQPQGQQELLVGYTRNQIQEQQEADPDLKQVKIWKASGQPCPAKETYSSLSGTAKYLIGHWDQLEVKDGLLYYCWHPDNPRKPVWRRIVAPRVLIPTVLGALHNLKSSGHVGMNKTVEKAKRSPFFWPQMVAEAKRWVRKCRRCQQRKAPAHAKRAKLVTYQSGGPWERVAMDVLGPLPTTPEGYKYVLVVMDYFTKWVEIFPMKDQTAETVAAVLVDEVFSRMGCLIELHSDQGSNFKSRVMTEVYRLMGIKKTQTTPYHLRGDGMVERMNRTLKDMLAHCVSERQTDWNQHLPLLAMAYRSAPHSTTAESPNLLMLGREVTLPVDLVVEPLPEKVEEPPNLSGYADDLLERMRLVNQAARAMMTQQLQSQKRHFDQNVHLTVHRPGDVVWLKLHASKKGKSPKLMRRWGGRS